MNVLFTECPAITLWICRLWSKHCWNEMKIVQKADKKNPDVNKLNKPFSYDCFYSMGNVAFQIFLWWFTKV